MARTEPQRRRRPRSRQAWPMRRFRLGEEPSDDLSDCTTVQERLAMMWPLARAAWLLAGPLPDYERANAPGRVLRSGDGTS